MDLEDVDEVVIGALEEAKSAHGNAIVRYT